MSDAYIWAMFLLWAKCPRECEPDADGMYNLGDVGFAPEKSFKPVTPYSPAQPIDLNEPGVVTAQICGIKFVNDTPRIAFVNDLEEPNRKPFFW
jgi:hypothetical protein